MQRYWITLLIALVMVSAAYAQTGIKPLTGGVSTEMTDLTNDLETSEALVQESPEDPEAHFLLGIAYSRTPYLEKALKELQTAKKLAKKSPEGYALFDRKIKEYEHMLVEKPDDPLVLYRLAFGYYMRGYGVEHNYIHDEKTVANEYYAKAEQTMSRLTEVMPEDIWAKNYLGFFLIEQDENANLNRAIALWENSLQVEPDNPGAYMLLGEAYIKQGNLKKGIEYGGRALSTREKWLAEHGKKTTP